MLTANSNHLYSMLQLPIISIVSCILMVAIRANEWNSGMLMCSPFGEYISLGGDCCTINSIGIGWRSSVPCVASKSLRVDCGQLSTFAAFKPEWQGLGTCLIYTIVCEPPAKPALGVWSKNDNGYKVYKECPYVGGRAMGITMQSVGDDQCGCPVGNIVGRDFDFENMVNATVISESWQPGNIVQ